MLFPNMDFNFAHFANCNFAHFQIEECFFINLDKMTNGQFHLQISNLGI